MLVRVRCMRLVLFGALSSNRCAALFCAQHPETPLTSKRRPAKTLAKRQNRLGSCKTEATRRPLGTPKDLTDARRFGGWQLTSHHKPLMMLTCRKNYANTSQRSENVGDKRADARSTPISPALWSGPARPGVPTNDSTPSAFGRMTPIWSSA